MCTVSSALAGSGTPRPHVCICTCVFVYAHASMHMHTCVGDVGSGADAFAGSGPRALIPIVFALTPSLSLSPPLGLSLSPTLAMAGAGYLLPRARIHDRHAYIYSHVHAYVTDLHTYTLLSPCAHMHGRRVSAPSMHVRSTRVCVLGPARDRRAGPARDRRASAPSHVLGLTRKGGRIGDTCVSSACNICVSIIFSSASGTQRRPYRRHLCL